MGSPYLIKAGPCKSAPALKCTPWSVRHSSRLPDGLPDRLQANGHELTSVSSLRFARCAILLRLIAASLPLPHYAANELGLIKLDAPKK